MTMLTLTLLDGPLAGRPMPLPPGSLTIGHGDSDIAMALEHDARIELHVDDNGARLVSAAPVWVDGAPFMLPNDDTLDTPALPLHTVIDLAGLGIWLADGTQDMPIHTPKRPERRAPCTASPSTAQDVAPRGRAPAAWIAVTGMSLLIAAAGVAIWRTGTANVISPPPQSDALKTLVARIAPQVALNTTGDTVRLTGGCLDDGARARLRAEARWQGKAMSDETWCPEDAMQTVNTLLRLHGFGSALVNVAADGEVVISGPLVADARWRAASDALDALSLPHGWRIAQGATQSFEQLVKTLREAGQLRGIDISRDRSGWRLTGALTAGRHASLKGIVDTWNATANAMPVRIEPLPAPIPTLGDTGFSAPLVSIGGSPDAPQLTLADGTRLAQGVRLPGGARVLAIHPDGVSVSTHDRLFYLPLTAENLHGDSSDPA
ncbi:type III secretion system inner membrane ring subunit SctD [Pandoraea fibrosis]|uniref:EscD/YscD/HrpQ family type III secretion system inner membrane ring protein n=1 Tax=Pandoraea fibrosis TaxID=1891094 RepID=A0A5E4WV48_9BURK|nr:type III secretion system inner membrane ring subunit SctD [Pandoraea fibrosis]VVE26865.1 EscD/YscD/HrpQ family type III secretion system inner membrane ring protein [Pandoraea fibrosis]